MYAFSQRSRAELWCCPPRVQHGQRACGYVAETDSRRFTAGITWPARLVTPIEQSSPVLGAWARRCRTETRLELGAGVQIATLAQLTQRITDANRRPQHEWSSVEGGDVSLGRAHKPMTPIHRNEP